MKNTDYYDAEDQPAQRIKELVGILRQARHCENCRAWESSDRSEGVCTLIQHNDSLKFPQSAVLTDPGGLRTGKWFTCGLHLPTKKSPEPKPGAIASSPLSAG